MIKTDQDIRSIMSIAVAMTDRSPESDLSPIAPAFWDLLRLFIPGQAVVLRYPDRMYAIE
jgi:hypothetical protein